MSGMQTEKTDRYYEEGCADCGNTKKLTTLSQRAEHIYAILIDKIDILNGNITEFTKTIQSHEIHIATLSQSVTSLSSDYKASQEKNSEDHRQIHSKINREIHNLESGLKSDYSGKIDKLDSRQFELVKELNQTIGRKTMLPTIISVISVMLMALTVVVTYIK